MSFEALTPGSEPEAWTYGPVSRTDFGRYQGASGDMNPVHHDELFATSSGFPAPLGVGMFTAGLMTTWATRWLGADNVRRTRIRWSRPVFPGAMLTFSGRIVERDEASRRVDLELQGADDAGSVVVRGWMSFEIPESP